MTWDRIREFVEKGMDFTTAMKNIKASGIFTTHTPVPAGNDTFLLDLIQKYFHWYWETPGLSREKFLELGIQGADNSVFNMTVLGLRTADYRNGVSKLHGGVCRQMWHSLWPDKEEKDVPIGSITNGIHVPTWIGPQMSKLYDKYLGNDWLQKHDDPVLWQGVVDIPDEELWTARRWLKNKLVSCMQNRARKRWCEDRVKSVQALALGGLFDPEVLTLGFCRRFTEYTRAGLILSDIERLKKLLHNELQPIQIIFAGKSHPNDGSGKHIIREVYNLATDPQFGCRIAFVEDYDMHTAQFLVQGVDIWLNTPRILQEASGTSGMKAAINGIPQISILDGWWYEGYNGANGWAIYNDTPPSTASDCDKSDANKLYSLLEEKVIPLYYDRDMNGIPHAWLKVVKETIRSNAPLFSAQRMAKEYMEQMYLPAINNAQSLTSEKSHMVSPYSEKEPYQQSFEVSIPPPTQSKKRVFA
jgi:starch phosphorylase